MKSAKKSKKYPNRIRMIGALLASIGLVTRADAARLSAESRARMARTARRKRKEKLVDGARAPR